jgi:hypothetical protein
LITNSPAANSPFIVGLAGHPDLEPAQFAPLVDFAVGFLRDLKQHLPDTDVRLMLDVCGAVNLAIVRAALALGISVDALIVAPARNHASGPDADILPDLRTHPRLQCIEVAAEDPSTRPDTPESIIADILVRRSSLLLALWDGRTSSAHDDTADTVFRFLGVHVERNDAVNRIEIDKVIDEMDLTARLVYWVPVRRSGADASAHIQQPHYLLAAGDNVLDVQETMPSSLRRRLADFNEYNVEFERISTDGSFARSESLMRNLPADLTSSDAAVLDNIDRQYVKADSLAGNMQWRSDRLFNMFGIMALMMGLAYLIYDKITESRILLIVYILILLAGLLAYYFFQAKRWFSKYLSTRVLAETLRVRFYLTLAGVDRRMPARALMELTGLNRFRGFSWIGFALDSIEPVAAETVHTTETYTRRARLVDQAWIEDQYRYFARKVAKMERGHRWTKRLKGVVFTVVLVVTSAMFIFGEALNHVDARTGLPVKNILTFFSGFLVVLLGVWELRQNKMAAQELLWQYRSQLSRFQRAKAQLQRITNRTRRDALLKELGENCLMEIYLWAIHRYHREHAPPAAL